jgi:lipoprotein-anchoring transpeptidase ErfK/SrfK
MRPDPESVRRILLNARQAMQRGDHQAARDWAEQAVALSPDSEEPWLFLAALASPRASVNFLERALKINPQSQRARKGMHWAVQRLRHEQAGKSIKGKTPLLREQGGIPGINKGYRPTSRKPSATSVTIQPPEKRLPAGPVLRSKPNAAPPLRRSLAKYRWPFLTVLLAAICITVAWAFWPGSASPVRALLRAVGSTPAFPGVVVEIDKPTYTPSPTVTFTPTATFTPIPTITRTPTSTATPSPTDTSTPTNTPWPTDTEIPLPTDTPEPVVNSGGGGERWIDVNLSEQRLYAFEGDALAASFLVSTGLSQSPTVTGQYHIYIKLLSTTMSGPGYYLPNVPYTMYFYKGYGIHGTYWHNNFGTPMSHGCVNMYTPDAEWLFSWASEGTLVNVHY